MDTDEAAAELTADEIAFLYGEPPDEVEVPEPDGKSSKPSATPESYGHAAWFAARAQEAEMRATEIGAEYDRLIRKLRFDRDKAVTPLIARAAWFDAGVEGWHRRATVEGEAGKSVTFPCGRQSKLRAAQPAVVVTNHDLHMAFVEEQGWKDVYVQASPADRWRVSELRKNVEVVRGSEPNAEGQLVTKNGEAVPGVKVIEQQDTWSNGQSKGKR